MERKKIVGETSMIKCCFTKWKVILTIFVFVFTIVSAFLVFNDSEYNRNMSSTAGMRTAVDSNNKLLEPNTYNLNLETSEQFGVYVNSVCTSDVDNDGTIEIITGGETSGYTAQLRIWNWDGTTLTLEHNEEWQLPSGNALAVQDVCTADVDADGRIEIISVNSISDVITSYGAQLTIWNWYGGVLTQEVSYVWAPAGGEPYVRSVCTADVDNDNIIEIITVGDVYYSGALRREGQLKIWRWDGTTLALEDEYVWVSATDPYVKVYSVCTADIDNDNVIEIITGGMTYDFRAELRIWNFDGSIINLEEEENWYVAGSSWKSSVRTVSAADVDSDSRMEIVTGAFFGNSTEIHAQLRIWNWWSGTLTLELSKEWFVQDHTAIYAISVSEIDGDLARPEIITVGTAKGVFYTSGRGEIRTWDWNGALLTNENYTEWDTGPTRGYAVCTSDVDGDNIPEIIVGGCIAGTAGELRIWCVAEYIPEFSIISVPMVVAVALFVVYNRFKSYMTKEWRK